MRILFLVLCLFTASAAAASETCTFSDWTWHSEQGRAVNYRDVVTTRSALSPKQRHPVLPCSVCREDQVEVRIGEASALVCKAIAGEVSEALGRAAADGFPVTKIVGYRVGRTKGPLDGNGLRTQYSHHSFGLAVDINPEQNGLYDRCHAFGPDCRLRRGGEWKPGTPGTITPQTPLYTYMREAGQKWGGELNGRQKDFMHFSLSGD